MESAGHSDGPTQLPCSVAHSMSAEWNELDEQSTYLGIKNKATIAETAFDAFQDTFLNRR
jgi:hypothetical protein